MVISSLIKGINKRYLKLIYLIIKTSKDDDFYSSSSVLIAVMYTELELWKITIFRYFYEVNQRTKWPMFNSYVTNYRRVYQGILVVPFQTGKVKNRVDFSRILHQLVTMKATMKHGKSWVMMA